MSKKKIITAIAVILGVLFFAFVAVSLSLGLFVDRERAKVAESFRILEERQHQPGHEKDYSGLHPFVVASQRMKDASDEDLLKEKKIYEAVIASNIGDSLAPENVTDLATLGESRKKIANLIQIIDAFENEQAKVNPSVIFQRIIAEEHVPLLYQKIMTQTAQVDYPEMLAEQKARTELERQYLLALDGFLAFMQTRHGTYTLRGNVIAFSKQSDIDIYNSSMQKLSQLNDQVVTAWKNFAAEGEKYKAKLQQDLEKLDKK